MVLDNGLILGLVGAFVSIFGIVITYIQSTHEKKQKKRSEAQKQIGIKRNELERIKAEKEEAHDLLTRYMAHHLVDNGDSKELIPLINEADAIASKFKEKEKELYSEMDIIYNSMH